ncbi:MAG: hypothetical protein H6581_16365 [Bacteroidia bacterium]|nr:hypothetical protein [Bacteroidia bacterium]
MYLEIEKNGSINNALNIEFEKIKSPLRVNEENLADKFPLTYARLEYGNKFSQVYLAAKEKLFLPDFWRDGVCLANGKTSEIGELVRAIDFWLLKDVATSELSLKFPFVRPSERAQAFDENMEIEYAWRLYSQNEEFKELREFVALAKEDEIIGKLFPYTSLTRLCLSRCTGYPYTYDLPSVIPIPNEKGKFEVRLAGESVIGRGNAREALDFLKENLPENIGRAVKGTADDL